MIVRRREGAILGQLQTLYNLGAIRELTDGQLLERFATDPDEMAELAFSALVERHEAMVWSVCLAIVRDEHDAEDAFQATFLVLVRKARTLWVRDSLGPWLHQVACRTASCLRTTANRRRKHEQRCAAKNAGHSVELETQRDFDLDAAIHEEVNRLPEKYRAPVVLCDLEGRTHQETARFLGWPIGTVKSRQSQARGMIRDRLVHRGLGLAVAGSLVESLRLSALAAMPKQILRSTVSAVMQQSARVLTEFVVSAHVLTLTQEVLQAMLWTRLRLLRVATLAVGIVFVGASVYVHGFQNPAADDQQQVSNRSTTTAATVQNPQTKTSSQATGQPATAAPRAKLRAQQLATRKAKATYEIARSTRELAEIAVEEYQEVSYPRERAELDRGIKFAKTNLTLSEDRVERARTLEKKYMEPAQKVTEELNFQKAKFAFEQLESRLEVLEKYTKTKTIKELKSEVEKSLSDELAKKKAWNRQKANEIELERQLNLRTN